MSDTIQVECLDCGKHSTYHTLDTQCPHCGSEWRQAVYDYPSLGKRLPGLLERRPFDMWRYRELLPLKGYNSSLSMGEGGTPLIHAPNLGLMLGCPNIYIKDERQGPTNSFKDRQAAIGIAALKEAGVTEAVLASTGNVAIAYSAHAARAGIKLWAFVTSLVPAEKMREVAIYGTQVVKVTATYDQAKKLAAEFARQRGYYLERGPRTIPSVEGMKTIAFEIAEQLTSIYEDQPVEDPAAGFSPAAMPASAGKNGRTQNSPAAWSVPDWYFQSVSGGLGPLGVQKGFHELMLMGLTRRMPGMAIIQAEGCSPMVKAWEQDLDVAEPVLDPRTHIATLATGDPGRTYTLLRERLRGERLQRPLQQGGGPSSAAPPSSAGLFAAVSDEETFRTIHILAKMEGISVEPAAAVAFAGLIRLARLGKIDPNHTIVVNCTGHTLPVETSILGDGWARSVEVAPVYTSTPATRTTSLPASPQEGLLSALNQVSAQRFPRIAIVDDTPDARRLIRRILQSTGDYTIFEATNGRDAIELVRQELPDLIILDLMMPEVDGFTVLDELKSQPETASIPVIVVTAKSLTVDENRRLRGQIHSLMQKGEFLSDELLEEIQSGVNTAGVAAGAGALTTGEDTAPSGNSSTSP